MDHPCRINTFLHFRSSWLTFKNYTTIITVKNEKTQYFSYRFFNALCAIHFSAHLWFYSSQNSKLLFCFLYILAISRPDLAICEYFLDENYDFLFQYWKNENPSELNFTWNSHFLNFFVWINEWFAEWIVCLSFTYRIPIHCVIRATSEIKIPPQSFISSVHVVDPFRFLFPVMLLNVSNRLNCVCFFVSHNPTSAALDLYWIRTAFAFFLVPAVPSLLLLWVRICLHEISLIFPHPLMSA